MSINKNSIIIQKFGGTSLATTSQILEIAKTIVQESLKKKLIIVVSAMAGATNESIAKCLNVNQINDSLSLEAYDAAVSNGENLSAALLTLALLSNGVSAKALQGWQIPILTNDAFSRAKIIAIDGKKILDYVELGIIPVICGFQGVTSKNSITTLGRGGSDTTAVAIAVAVAAKCCEIYTDVEGVFSADPRLVEKVQKINSISYEEMLCFSKYGAKVLERRSVEIAMRYNIAIKVIKTNSQQKGTTIATHDQENNMEISEIKGITLKNDILFCKIRLVEEYQIPLFIAQLKSISCYNVNINFGQNTCTFEAFLSEKSKIHAIAADRAMISECQIDCESGLVVMVGWSIGENCNLLQKICSLLREKSVKDFRLSSEEHCIKIKVPISKSDALVKYLHSNFLEENRTISY